MKNIWLSIPMIVIMGTGCSATIKGMQTDTLNAARWTHQQIDNTRRIIHNGTRE